MTQAAITVPAWLVGVGAILGTLALITTSVVVLRKPVGLVAEGVGDVITLSKWKDAQEAQMKHLTDTMTAFGDRLTTTQELVAERLVENQKEVAATLAANNANVSETIISLIVKLDDYVHDSVHAERDSHAVTQGAAMMVEERTREIKEKVELVEEHTRRNPEDRTRADDQEPPA